jgi:GNAT superfamily N-acetyltransferase
LRAAADHGYRFEMTEVLIRGSVRRATIGDLDRLVPLFDGYRQFYGQRRNLRIARDFLAARLRQGQSIVLLAEQDDGTALGFVQLFPSFSSVRAAPICILNDLFVAPTARRRGVGALLLEAAAEAARAAGAVRLNLNTAVTNESAQRLYEAHGWKRDEEFYGYNLSL